jgi:hypothetical protein
MRAFWLACVAIVVVGAGGYFFLNAMQESTGIAYTTDGARISPNWAWRSVFRSAGANSTQTKTATADECDQRRAWQWIFVDLGRPHGEPATCSVSQ